MFGLAKKFIKPLVALAAVAAILMPALAAASGESYYWQSSSHSAIVGTGGVYTNGDITFTGPAPKFQAPQAISCSDGSAKADLTITSFTTPAATGSPSTASLSASCDVAADTQAISIYADKASAQAAAQTANSADPANPSCKGGVLSWFICPVYDFILNSIKTIENQVIVPFLKINPISNSSNSPPYEIWQQFRNLANVGFIIVFLILIFGHTLSLGVDSYSLKKTLPRLVMAAILVQFSFLLVTLGVDVANILGAGVQGLVLAPLKGNSTLVINGVNGTIGIAVGITAAFAAAGSVLTGGILIILIGAFFAVIAIFLTLVARQILVMLLLILSPLAFVAWILPNTQNLFKLWRTSLVRMLLMYPMIVLLFASGKLFASAAMAAGSNGGAGGDATNALLPLIAVVANVIPLYFVPMTFKYSGTALATMNGFISNLTNATKKRTESSDGYERLKKRTQQRRTELAAGETVKGFGAITGNKFAAHAFGRGIVNPSGYGAGANVRAMVAYTKSANDWKKRLEEENMGFEGLTYLSRGEAWFQGERRDITQKISAARAAGNINETKVQEAALARLEDGKKAATPYFNSSTARAAAALKLSEYDVLQDSDRTQMMDYTRYDRHEPGKLIGENVWGRAKEGARKTNVHLAFTDIKGNLDADGLRKFVMKKNQGAWTDYTVDAIKTMADKKYNVLQQLAAQQETRQVLVNILSHTGGPSIGAEQQVIIKQVLREVASPGGINKDIRPDGSIADGGGGE